MVQTKRILCPIDFSATSDQAFAHCEALARDLEAELVLLHVVGVPDFWGSGGMEHALEADQELVAQLTAIRPSSADVKVDHILHAGPAGEVIAWTAQEKQCDLIVMGTHGRTGLSHLVLGSVAEHVVRHARCPVLTVRHIPPGEPPLREPEVHVPVPPMI